VCTKSRK